MTTKSALLIALLALSASFAKSFSISEPPKRNDVFENVGRFAMSSILGSCMLFNSHLCPSILPGGEATAADSRLIGEIAGSGLVFKVSICSLDSLYLLLPATDHSSFSSSTNNKRTHLRLNRLMIPKSRA